MNKYNLIEIAQHFFDYTPLYQPDGIFSHYTTAQGGRFHFTPEDDLQHLESLIEAIEGIRIYTSKGQFIAETFEYGGAHLETKAMELSESVLLLANLIING